MNSNNFVPKKIFLTKGIGFHKEKLASFELALREAGIAPLNLITVSSILPPHCKFIDKDGLIPVEALSLFLAVEAGVYSPSDVFGQQLHSGVEGHRYILWV